MKYEEIEVDNEIIERLEKNKIYLALKEKLTINEASELAVIQKSVSYAVQRSKVVIKYMGEYTLHDETHLFRVLELMSELIGEENLKSLSSPELMLLILSCFFHDLGMAPTEFEVQAFTKVFDVNVQINANEKENYKNFERFVYSYPDQIELINNLVKKQDHFNANTLKGYLISEYIRRTHADRAKQIIKDIFKDQIKFHSKNLSVELAQICYSHNQDGLLVLKTEKDLKLGDGISACIPMLCTLLRLADILDFDGKRTPSSLFSHLNIKHPVSLSEWQKHRNIDFWEIREESITFSATCNHPAIQSSIHKFCDLIDKELRIANNVFQELKATFEKQARLIEFKLPLTINRDHIKAVKDIDGNPKYDYSNTSFTLSKQQVVGLLMGTELYGNPEVAIRELIQNSIDTCLLRKSMESNWGTSFIPLITVKFLRDDGEVTFEVEDNGCGMDKDIIDNYYSKIGSSFYKSSEFYGLKHELNSSFIPRSRFGIGILSCFMVSDTIEVQTKRLIGNYSSSDPLKILIQGQDSIFWIQKGNRSSPGTNTKLSLRSLHNPLYGKSDTDFVQLVKKLIPNPPFKIFIETKTQNAFIDFNAFDLFSTINLTSYNWTEREFIRFFDIELKEKTTGILGKVKIAILELNGEPVEEVELNEREVSVENESFTLKRHLRINENSIVENFQTISISDDNSIHEYTSSSQYNRSISRFSLHGIEIPSSLFLNQWELRPNQVKLALPFSAIMILDVSEPKDLKLNSARTEILSGEEWDTFEIELIYQIIKNIINQVTDEYWQTLKQLFLKRSSNTNFISGVEKASIECENMV